MDSCVFLISLTHERLPNKVFHSLWSLTTKSHETVDWEAKLIAKQGQGGKDSHRLAVMQLSDRKQRS